MARRRKVVSDDDVLVGAVLAFGPLLALVGGAVLIERWRRRQSVFRPDQQPPVYGPNGEGQ